MKLFKIFIFLILVSCNSQKKVSEVDEEITTNKTNNRLELLVQESDSDFESSETQIIRDNKRLKSFYTKINMTRKPGLPVPEVDFTKDLIIVQCSGNQKGIREAELIFKEESDTEIILYSKIVKTTDKATANYVTSPFCIYKMPLTNKNVIVESAIQ